MAKSNKASSSSSKRTTTTTTKTRSTSHAKKGNKPSAGIPQSTSKSTAKGRKVRDRRDVQGMNGLDAIGELQATLNSSKRSKQVKPAIQLQPQQSAGELADALASSTI